jgi:20S proteasome alpha/beta subunit
MSTLIIGTSCSDGVVLAADRRELRGYEPSERAKIRQIKVEVRGRKASVLLAGAGIAAFWDEVAWSLPRLIEGEGGSSPVSLPDVVERIGSLSIDLSARYQREGLNEPLGCVVAGLEELSSGEAQMYYFAGAGFSKTDFICLGSGDKYALPTADVLLHGRALKVEEAVQAMPFLFFLVERVNVSVGGGPDVFALTDDTQAVQVPSRRIEKIKTRICRLETETPQALLSALENLWSLKERSQR